MSDVHAALRLQQRRLSEAERALAEARRDEKRCEEAYEQARTTFTEFCAAMPERERALYAALWGQLVKLRDLDEVAANVAALKNEAIALEMRMQEAEQTLLEANQRVDEHRQIYSDQAVRTEKYVEWVQLLDAALEKAREQAEEAEQMDDAPVLRSLSGGVLQ